MSPLLRYTRLALAVNTCFRPVRTVLVSLELGTRLGHYLVVAPLGAGGMGEVYRASDTKLGREVAPKVLPPELARDSERRAPPA